MLRGDGGEIWLRGRRVATITSWEMPPVSPVVIRARGHIPALWLRPTPARATLRLRRSKTGYDLWFAGDIHEATAGQVVLHRCEECNRP